MLTLFINTECLKVVVPAYLFKETPVFEYLSQNYKRKLPLEVKFIKAKVRKIIF